MWYFCFSHQCSWTLESSGMWRRVSGGMVHGVSTDRNAFIFRVKNSFFFLTACAENEGHTMPRKVGRCSSSNSASRPRKSESLRTFVLPSHTKTRDWSLFPFITVVDVFFLSTKWKWLGRSVQALRFFSYASDAFRDDRWAGHTCLLVLLLQVLMFQLNAHTCVRWCYRRMLLLYQIVRFIGAIL